MRVLKPVVFLAALVPLALMLRDVVTQNLPAEPIKDLTHRTGFWGLFFITVTLAITPLRRLTGWNQAQSLRRTLGLFGFTYIVIHFLIYLVLDQFFAWEVIAKDIAKRPYITVGFAGFLMLIPLAVTSTRGWVRRLGKRWAKLHALVYVIALAGIVHFSWSVKADRIVPERFAVAIVVLLVSRLVYARLLGSRVRPRPLAVRPEPTAVVPATSSRARPVAHARALIVLQVHVDDR